ncbi:MAG: RagB/SusD family nutrient uptake outer membrane protein [Sphingobacteriales bacterium]|nr:RagB/SusD family nutrient uptake outer membrane protein [Sphingobacteriales bacterium]MBI3717392.1 RagB/SusD family nutrient uptake outer membrane protein [Sphingobacteriales bacterium]
MSCKKFLDTKSNQTLTTPSTVADLQMLLDTWYSINQRDANSPLISADEYYLTTEDWLTLEEYERNTFTWQPANLFVPGTGNDWANNYNIIYNANTVLQEIEKIKPVKQAEWNNAKGHALFLRGKSFFQLLTIFSPAYDEATAANDLGICLRLSPDFNIPSVRSTVKQSFDQAINDLQQSIPLLPLKPIHPLRPSKAAAYGYLARAYLYMRQYEKAGLYADSALAIQNTLIDYNSPVPGYFDPNTDFPFSRFNPEVIYSCGTGSPSSVYYGYTDTVLIKSYDENDWRRTLYFAGPQIGSFKGSYEGTEDLFDGIAADECFLIRAESLARANKKEEALNDLNHLLLNRYKSGTFSPVTAITATEALNIILMERRKELFLRGLRWQDIKRLNKEGANITLKRTVNSKEYSLPPNDFRYALPIPEDVIKITGIPQNPR